MSQRYIPVGAPVLAGKEKEYVLDCLDSSWISSQGKYLDLFEESFAAFCGTRHALACSNGTVALHLALMAFDLSPGDEVIVPALTYVATANAVAYCGATPIFVDSEPLTGNINPALIEALITPRTRGIIAVHLYGHPADMDALAAIAKKHDLFLVEDAAEAHGALYRGRKAGSLSDVATFSFYGNKILTCGEGGMLTTDDDKLAAKIELLKGQGMDLQRRYWFSIVGYNYRLTNVAAAIGLAQLEMAEWHLAQHARIIDGYHELLKSCAGITWQQEQSWAKPAHWMFTFFLKKDDESMRDSIMRELLQDGVETRPVFYPLHTLPPYLPGHGTRPLPVCERLARTGINLPTWSGLTRDDIEYVSHHVTKVLARYDA